ncbi:MAG: ATP-binding protein [Eubacteriales bacterium]|nr:ATP-binding protein [Eubacteriales bacterium]MDD3883050.1 ATP-binding protein [Eubacteriales bacterium]MDD4513601.1 ATP-binding protein [Eubacteriales bacterium]
MENLEKLICELCKLPNETQWLEFKHNNYEPEMIGRDISALANSAAIYEKSCAYMLWGIDDETHEIVGTEHSILNLKKGNQELENWLRSLLSRNADFEFHSVLVNEKNVGVLIIFKAVNQTVMFEKTDYIRVGSYTKKLSEYPSLQAQLWDRLRNEKFEERYARQDFELQRALQMLDYSCKALF